MRTMIVVTQILIIEVFARIGSWCCRRAITLAGSGYIEFEAATPFMSFNAHLIHDRQNKVGSFLVFFGLIVYVFFLVGILDLIFNSQ
jgi:predicted permease